MLRDRPQTQSELEFVCIDELVPSDHLLRKVDRHIDFSFIHDLVCSGQIIPDTLLRISSAASGVKPRLNVCGRC